ncbi:hypothetical protein N0B31_05470 [Salinirubellus salinus]|uniref:Uncharacterized protein n=1 Tax=Salinirubellus salinus TaxID=1364945 RepID=A0A9E7R6S6_9EURY|nr:hypothetical protein [Salinirubellus salinus]UWM55733.1 hypothetical protein N0B31_05470 [Salinirubellus salinus]
MNRLPAAGEDAWHLARHAHVIVHETADGNEFLTVYDCGAAQKPPSAQVIGNLVRVRAAHETVRQPTGYIVKMREPSVLVREDDDHWLVRAAGDHGDSDGRGQEPDADGRKTDV